MIKAEQVVSDIKAWSLAHLWYAKVASKLKDKHFKYMLQLVEKMDSLDNEAMNRAWCGIPESERLSDSGSRVVCELISSYSTAQRRSV